MIFFHLGGSCEPGMALLEDSYRSKAEIFSSPFDWLGVPTEVLPNLLNLDNWCRKVFNNNVLYRAQPADYIGVRDLEYNINTVHHFKRNKNFNFHEIIEKELPLFREKMISRWEKICDHLDRDDVYIFYREYNPTYFKNSKTKTQAIQDVYESAISFAPKAKLIMVCDTIPNNFEKAVILKQKPHDRERFNQTPDWYDCWYFIINNIDILEKGRCYTHDVFPKTKAKRISR